GRIANAFNEVRSRLCYLVDPGRLHGSDLLRICILAIRSSSPAKREQFVPLPAISSPSLPSTMTASRLPKRFAYPRLGFTLPGLQMPSSRFRTLPTETAGPTAPGAASPIATEVGSDPALIGVVLKVPSPCPRRMATPPDSCMSWLLIIYPADGTRA